MPEKEQSTEADSWKIKMEIVRESIMIQDKKNRRKYNGLRYTRNEARLEYLQEGKEISDYLIVTLSQLGHQFMVNRLYLPQYFITINDLSFILKITFFDNTKNILYTYNSLFKGTKQIKK